MLKFLNENWKVAVFGGFVAAVIADIWNWLKDAALHADYKGAAQPFLADPAKALDLAAIVAGIIVTLGLYF